MKLLVNRLESILIDMRINLRRRYRNMPQHLLQVPQIRTTRQHMRRKAMSNRMNRQLLRHTRPKPVLFHQPPVL